MSTSRERGLSRHGRTNCIGGFAGTKHAAATQAYERIKNENCELLTSRPVLLECGNAAARRPYRSHVIGLKEAMEEDGV